MQLRKTLSAALGVLMLVSVLACTGGEKKKSAQNPNEAAASETNAPITETPTVEAEDTVAPIRTEAAVGGENTEKPVISVHVDRMAYSVEELIDYCDCIVIGRIVGKSSEWLCPYNHNNGEKCDFESDKSPYTIYDVIVDEALYGDYPEGCTINMLCYGGDMPEALYLVDEGDQFETDDKTQYFLFLKRYTQENENNPKMENPAFPWGYGEIFGNNCEYNGRSIEWMKEQIAAKK